MAPQLIYDEETGQYLTPDQVDPNDPNYTFEPVEAPSTLGQVGNFFSYVGNDLAKEGIGALYSGLDAFGVESPTLEEAYRSRFNKQQAQRKLLGLDDPDSLRDDLIDLGLGATKVGALTAGSALTTGPAAPFTTAGALGVLGGGNKYAESKLINPDPNLTDRERAIAALTSGISTSATSLPFSVAASKAAPFLSRVLSAGKEGAIGSVLDQPLQELSDRILERKAPESTDDYIDYAGDVLGRAPYAAATGFAMGAGAGAAQGALSKLGRRTSRSSSEAIDPVSAEMGAASILDDMAAEGGPVEFALRDIEGPGDLPPPASPAIPELPAPEPRLALPEPEGMTGLMPDGSVVADRPFGLNNEQGLPLKGYTETGDPFFDYYAPERKFDFTPSEFDAPAQSAIAPVPTDPVIPARKVKETTVLKGEFPEPVKVIDDFVAQERAIADSLPQPKKKSEAPSPAPDLVSPPIEDSASSNLTIPPNLDAKQRRYYLDKIFDSTPVTQVPIDSIAPLGSIKELKNMKRAAGENDLTKPIPGKYARSPLLPVTIYEQINSLKGIATGRHRFDIAKRSNEKNIPAQVLREADGWNFADMRRIDREANIRDDKGDTYDFALYFRENPEINKQEALDRGLLSDKRAQQAFDIAQNGSSELFAAFANNKITEDQTYAIVDTAKDDSTLQQIGLRLLLKDPEKNPRRLADALEAFRLSNLSMPKLDRTNEQMPLFEKGSPDALKLELNEKQSDEAHRLRKEASSLRLTLQRIAKNPDIANKAELPDAVRVDINDPIAIQEKINQLQEREFDLSPRRWLNVPEIRNEVFANVERQLAAPPKKAKSKSRLSSQETPTKLFTEQERAVTENLARDIAGQIVYQNGDLALIRGHSSLSGQPVYVVAKGALRSQTDIETFKGNLITPQQRSELIEVKNQIEAQDALKHAQDPFVRFDKDGIAVSQNVDPKIGSITAGWKKLLNIEPNVYLTTVDDATANIDKFTGPHRAISSAALEANSRGSMRRVGDDYYVAFKPGTSKLRMLEVIAHELGHIHQQNVFDKADPRIQQAIRAEHAKFLEVNGNKSAQEYIDALRNRLTGRFTDIVGEQTVKDISPYWKSFSEWYADQVSKWSLTSEKPVTVVEQFFSRLGQSLKRFYYTLKGQKYLPNETVRDFIENATKPRNESSTSSAPQKSESLLSRLSSQRGAIEPDVGQAVSDAAWFAGGKAKDFWNLLKSARQEIAIDQPLPDSERFLSGKDNVLGSVAGAYRKAMVFPRTLANKFPQAKAALDAGWKLIDNRNTVATESRAILDPLYRLSEQDRAPINKLLIENRLASAKYMEQYKQRMPELTNQMLAKRGLNADQINAYRRVRGYTEYALDIVKDAMTRQLDLLNISPEQKGIAQINVDQYINQLRDTHYVPLDRPPGNFAVRVEGPDGGTEWYSVHKTKREAFAQKQDLIKGGQKNAVIEELSNTRLEDNNSLPIDLEIMMRDVFPKDAKAGKEAPPAGFRAHLLKARMIPGFDTNMTVNLSRYALSLANYYARVTSNVAFKKEMAKIPSNERALTNYLNTWYDDLRAGTNPMAAKITRAATIYQLAGVPVSGLINTTQTLTTTHATLTSKNLYGLKGAPAALSRAIGDSWDYMNAVRKGDLRGFAAKSPRHAELAAALQRGQSLGVLNAEAYGELANFQKGIFEPTSVADTLMKTFTIPEKANRVIAFSAGFNAARQKLGLPFNEAVTYAKEFVNKTQFEQSDANRPKLARGAVGRIAFQFKLFTGNYLRFLRDATAAKDYNVVATSLGAMFGLAGNLGLPGVSDAVDLLDALFGTDSRQSVRKLIGSSAGDALLYGLPSLVGVNISPAAGLGDVVPNLDQGGWAAALQLVGGPAGAIPMKWAKGYQAWEKDAPWNAAANALPRMLRGPIKALELATTGNLQTVDGDNILPEGYDTPATIGSVAAGLTPKAYSDFYAKGQAKFKLSERARDNDDINMRLAKALKQGDNQKAQAIIAESLNSIRDNPDNPIAWKQINEQVVQMYLLPKQLRDLARAPKEIRGQILDIENSYPEK